jgi:hypothetical protein
VRPTPPTKPRATPPRAWWALVPALAFGASLLLRIGDGDPWWHLATGQWILQHGTVPDTDPFSHTAAGPWRYTEAAAQVLYAATHRLGGDAALTLLHAGLGAALAGAIALTTRARASAAVAVTGLACAASHSAMSAKPQIFSYVMFVLVLGLVRGIELQSPPDRRAGAKLTLLALAIGLAWGWLHRGGVLGAAVVMASAVAWSLTRERRGLARLGLLITVAMTVGLALNPGGTFYFESALDLAGRSSFRTLLMDWQPPTASLLIERHAALIPLVALALGSRARSWRRIDGELLVLLGTALLASRSVRFVPFLAFTSAAPAARALEDALGWVGSRTSSVRPALLDAAAAVLGLAWLGAQFVAQVPPAYVGLGAMESRVPVDLSAWLRENPPPGRRWNSFDLGGYLLYALAPEQRVFVDGRNDTVYDDAFFRTALESAQNPAEFAAVSARYDIGHVVLSWRDVSRADLPFLHGDPLWALVYWDDVGAVMVRRSPASAAYVERHAYRLLRIDNAFPIVGQLAARPASAWSAEESAFAREVLRNAEQAPRSLRAALLATAVLRSMGDPRYPSLRDAVNRTAAERGLPLRAP